MKNEVVIVISTLDSRFPMQRITSVLLDDDEMCDRARVNDQDTVLPNQPNKNALRFLNNCYDVLPRSNREPDRCEILPEVTIQSFRFNDEIPFYCVVIDKTVRGSAPNMAETAETIQLALESPNFLISWSPRANFASRVQSRFFSFHFLRDIMRIAIYPKDPLNPIADLSSLKLNNLESCGSITRKVQTENCGKILIKAKPLISFSSTTYPGQYPWHVALYRLDGPGSRKYICGGSIITATAVLTAAHCVDTANGITVAAALRVEAGRFDLTISSGNVQEVRVFEVIVHEKFDREFLYNDIAIFKLATELRYTDFVQPICMTDDDRLFVDKLGKLPGWGRNENDQLADQLGDASMPVVSRDDCRDSNRNFFPVYLYDANFCAGLRNGMFDYFSRTRNCVGGKL